MVKKTGDIKGGITKPKEAKPAEPASKHAATAVNLKRKAEINKKDSAALKKGASVPPKEEQSNKSSFEIDGLFGQLKGATSASADKTKKEAAAEQNAPAVEKRRKITGSKDDIFGTEIGQARKKTEEGYNIYKEDELGFGKKGGDTDKCPFDCDCCF
ncbi:hypothetical protein Ndes2526B_g01125 [Nannochloris sp. 'desiccata']|nr:hypothetical protein KSW81_004521 [Chlorella desiccata (nom. nud.)]